MPRLRQAALVAHDLDAVAGRLRAELGLGEPYADPGVGLFGLRNAVFALGDGFLEVVAPVEEGTAAGRQLERLGGDGGYMAIFDVGDRAALDAARARAAALSIRDVWSVDLEDISATHLHPADVGGAIVSLDAPDPPGSWRWGGPEWTGRAGAGAPGALRGVVVEAPDPARTAGRWAEVLGVERAPGVRFAAGDRGLVAIEVALPPAVRDGREAVEVGGVRFLLGDHAA